MRTRVHRFALPLRRPMGTAHGRITTRKGFLVELEDRDGARGYGEATPLPDFGTEGVDACLAALENGLAGPTFDDPLVPAADHAQIGGPGATATPCAAFALETAQADLHARRAGERLVDRLARLVRRDPVGDLVPSQVVVAGESAEVVAAQAGAARDAGATAFKLKVAVRAPGAAEPDLALDLDRVAALRERVGPAARIRLDANEGWTEAQAERALVDLARHAVDYVEQPVARDDFAAMARLDAAGVTAIAADEALQGDGWLAVVDELRFASVWILKPAALGGLRRARAIAERARSLGLRTVWSTLVDGAIGRATATSLAAAFGEPGEVHGLGTAEWLSHDLAPPDRGEGAHAIRLRGGPGHGVTPRIGAEVACALVLDRTLGGEAS